MGMIHVPGGNRMGKVARHAANYSMGARARRRLQRRVIAREIGIGIGLGLLGVVIGIVASLGLVAGCGWWGV